MRVLVTGANGFLGKKVCALFRRKGASITRCDLPAVDITDAKSVRELFSKRKPALVVHAAALTDVDGCESRKRETFRVNVKGTENVARACGAQGAKMVFISTDFVFDGKKRGAYTESDKPRPLNVYAKSKAMAETAVQRLLPDAIIIRTGVLYGHNGPGDKKSFAHWVLGKLRDGKPFRVVDDQFAQPSLIDDVAEGIWRLAKADADGVFNLTGSEYLSRYAFAKKIAAAFGFDPRQVRPMKTRELKQKADRPLKLKTSHAKIRKVGIHPSNVADGLRRMKGQMQ